MSKQADGAGPEPGVTELLVALRGGDREAIHELLPLVYAELRTMAHRQLRRNRPGQTLDTTALVHEAYLKMVDAERAEWNDRNHFLAVAATAMRYILVDYARRRGTQKRGGGAHHTLFDEAGVGVDARAVELIDLDDALVRLSELSERLTRLVELRFFAGLSVEESASALDVSPATVKRDWRKAQALLHRMLGERSPGS